MYGVGAGITRPFHSRQGVSFYEPICPSRRFSGVVGIACAAGSLAVFGAENMVIPAMVMILVILLGGRKRL